MSDHKDAPKSFTKDVVFRSKFINEALNQGLKFGSNMFRVYHQLRWFEEEGDYKWSVASYKTLGEYVNLPEKEVRISLDKLRKKNIVQHILTDKKWYRAKTDLWATTIALNDRGIMYENMTFLDKGKHPNQPKIDAKTSLPGEETSLQSEETSPPGEACTPIKTGVGNNSINNNINSENLTFDNNNVLVCNSCLVEEEGCGDTSPLSCVTAPRRPADPFASNVEFNGDADKKKTRGEYAEATNLIKELLPKFGTPMKRIPSDLKSKAKHMLEIYPAEAILSAVEGYLTADWVESPNLYSFLSEGALGRFVSNSTTSPKVNVVTKDDPYYKEKALAMSLRSSGVPQAQDHDYWMVIAGLKKG